MSVLQSDCCLEVMQWLQNCPWIFKFENLFNHLL